MYKFLRPLCGTLALAALATTANAQASINVTADVSTQLTVAGTRALDFGTVFPGFTKAVAATNGSSGKFTLNGGPGAQVNVTFVLPTNLTSGVNTLPIASWTGCRNTTDTPSGCLSFTPSATGITTPLGTGGVLVLFVGASVTAGATQASGTYTGTVSITAAYTGT
jgi:uncharacterized protein DUF4402